MTAELDRIRPAVATALDRFVAAQRCVLAEMDPSQKAKADFEAGVVGISAEEFATAVAVATERKP